jgi:hypothetical protein
MYNIIEQVRMVGASLSSTARSQVGISGCPGYLAIRGNSLEGFDAPGAWSQGIYFTDWSQGSYTIDNNFLQGIGQNIYFEANGTPPANHNDVSITHNYLSWPLYTLPRSSTWDGYDRLIRNQFETKRSRRLAFSGNIIDGQWAYQNEGSAILLAGNRTIYTGDTGVTDASFQSNIIRHAANVIDCSGTGGANSGPPDNSVNRRVQFTGNLAMNLGRYLYTYSTTGLGPSLYSLYVLTSPGCQDLVVKQNTFGFTNADAGNSAYSYIPSILSVGAGAQLSEGFYFQNNIAFFSVGNPTSWAGIWPDMAELNSNYPRLPSIVTSNSYSGVFNTAMVLLDGTSGAGTVMPF